MIEVVEQINAVRRRAGTRVLEAGEARTVIISPVYAAPAADVWDACTNPARIPRWFVPVSGDLRAGGQDPARDRAHRAARCWTPGTARPGWRPARAGNHHAEQRVLARRQPRRRDGCGHGPGGGRPDHGRLHRRPRERRRRRLTGALGRQPGVMTGVALGSLIPGGRAPGPLTSNLRRFPAYVKFSDRFDMK